MDDTCKSVSRAAELAHKVKKNALGKVATSTLGKKALRSQVPSKNQYGNDRFEGTGRSQESDCLFEENRGEGDELKESKYVALYVSPKSESSQLRSKRISSKLA